VKRNLFQLILNKKKNPRERTYPDLETVSLLNTAVEEYEKDQDSQAFF
jgi:hypothetical protein